MDNTRNWSELVEQPGGEHFVQVYQELDFLAETVTCYLGGGLRRGEAALVIATPEHQTKFLDAVQRGGLNPQPFIVQGQLRLLDAEQTLARVLTKGMPEWKGFHEIVGGAIAELRLQYPKVRAYSEMVDLLWQRGEREAAIRLEDYWNELRRLQTLSLFCAYCMDNLDPNAYGGPLESLCKVHTHLIPVRDYMRLNRAVREATKKVLDQPLAQMLLSLSANHRPVTQMPPGQATLLWLKQNMPRTADKVLQEVRASRAGSA
jgi:hypothetical protein